MQTSIINTSWLKLIALSAFLLPCVSTLSGQDIVAVSILGVQYAPAFEKSGYNTAEVFIRNGTGSPVTFAGGELDGAGLPSLDVGAAQRLAAQFRPQIGGMPVAGTPMPSLRDGRLTWWQFYPSATVAPGGTILCQIGFKGRAAQERELLLRTTDAAVSFRATVPGYWVPRVKVNAVTWARDAKTMFVQYAL